jgi:sporulation integral membrane protein YtvI
MEQRELNWHDRGRLWLRLGIRLILAAAAVLFLIFAVPPLISLLLPFVLAFLVSWMLNPLIRALQKRLGIPRPVLSLIFVLLIFGITGGIFFVFFSQIVSELIRLANNWQAVWAGIQTAIDRIGGASSGFMSLLPTDVQQMASGLLDQLLTWLQSTASDLIGRFAAGAGNWAIGIPSFMVALVVFIMGAYFMTADYPRLRYFANEGLPPEVCNFLRMLRTTAGTAFGGYIRAQLFLSLGVMIILLLGFLLIRQPYALLIAFIFAVLDFIPIVGAGTAMVPWAAYALFVGDARLGLSVLVIWGVVVLYRRVAEPKMLGSQTGLSPIISLVSIYAGMQLGGVVGMVLGPILALMLRNMCRSGLFDGLSADLKLALSDIAAILKGGAD